MQLAESCTTSAVAGRSRRRVVRAPDEEVDDEVAVLKINTRLAASKSVLDMPRERERERMAERASNN